MIFFILIECADYQKICSTNSSALIIDGEKAAPKEFPYMVITDIPDLYDIFENRFVLLYFHFARLQLATIKKIKLLGCAVAH